MRAFHKAIMAFFFPKRVISENDFLNWIARTGQLSVGFIQLLEIFARILLYTLLSRGGLMLTYRPL